MTGFRKLVFMTGFIAAVSVGPLAADHVNAGFRLVRQEVTPDVMTNITAAATAMASDDWKAARRLIDLAAQAQRNGRDQRIIGSAFTVLGNAQKDDALLLLGTDMIIASGELRDQQLPPYLRTQARLALAAGDFEKTSRAAELLLLADRFDLDAMVLLSDMRVRQDRREEAYLLVDRAIRIREALLEEVPREWRTRRDAVASASLRPASAPGSDIAIKPIRPPSPRVALVVGNSSYGGIGSLPNPANDARLVADSLRIAGFDIELMIDGDQRAMQRAISRLGQRLTAAGQGSTALFFYAGHGIQWQNDNYLIPIGSEIESEADVQLEAIPAAAILSQMISANASTSIVILDACRNTPVMRSYRSGGAGLALMNAPNGAFIAYSTAPGSVAADGDGRNSPFAMALAPGLRRRGQPIESLFRDVRREVLLATGGRQTPWDSSSLLYGFQFIP